MIRTRIQPGSPSTPADRERLADMLATRQPPGTKGTDRAYLQGVQCGSNLDDMPAFSRKVAMAKAKAAGVNIEGKRYCSTLGQTAYDPRAWFDNTYDLKKRAAELNIPITGIVTQGAHETPPKKPIGLAQDIVDAEVNAIIAKEPEKAKKRHNVEADVRDKHTPHYAKGTI